MGDRWALLVLRELGFGVHRFNDIQANTGAPRDSLATRLRQLEEAGLITRQRYSEHPRGMSTCSPTPAAPSAPR